MNEKRALNLLFDVLNTFNTLFYRYTGNKMLETHPLVHVAQF